MSKIRLKRELTNNVKDIEERGEEEKGSSERGKITSKLSHTSSQQNTSPYNPYNHYKTPLMLFTFLILTLSFILVTSYSLQHVDYHKAWIPLHQIALSYMNPITIDQNNNNKIDTQFLEVSLQNITDVYGLTSTGTLNIGNVNVAGMIIGTLLNIASGLLYVDPSLGKVGVGTTNPNAKLDVNGNLKIGYEETTCDTTTEGTIRFNTTTKQYEVCSDGEWFILKKIPKSGLKIRIYNPNSYSLTDFQVRVNVSDIVQEYGTNFALYTDTGIPVNYCFEQSNGECNETYAGIDWIWVKVPRMYGNENTWLRVKKTTTPQAVNGEQVFDFYDDFNDGVLDTGKWIVDTGLDYIISSGVLTVNNRVGLSTFLPFRFQDGYISETRVNVLEDDISNSGVFASPMSSPFTATYNANSDATILYMSHSGSTGRVATWIGDGSAAAYNVCNGCNVDSIAYNIWNIRGVSVLKGDVKLWRDNMIVSSYSNINWYKDLRYIRLGYFVRISSTEYNMESTSYDWIRVRKYADQEPIVEVVRD